MYYICDKKGNKYGVKDSSDGVVEYYTEAQLYNIVKNTELAIFGVEGFGIIVTGQASDFRAWFSNTELEKLVDAITSDHDLVLSYSSRSNGGDGTAFVNRYCYTFSRHYSSGEYTFYDNGRSKSYRTMDRETVLSYFKDSLRYRDVTIVVRVNRS